MNFDRIFQIIRDARKSPFPAIGLALAILIPGIMHYSESRGGIFGKYSLHAEGIVTNAHYLQAKPDGITTWMLEVEFIDSTGRKRLAMESKTHEEMRCYENGRKVSVYYRRDNPRVTYIGAKRYTWQFYITNILSMAFVVFILHMIGVFPASYAEDKEVKDEDLKDPTKKSPV